METPSLIGRMSCCLELTESWVVYSNLMMLWIALSIDSGSRGAYNMSLGLAATDIIFHDAVLVDSHSSQRIKHAIVTRIYTVHD